MAECSAGRRRSGVQPGDSALMLGPADRGNGAVRCGRASCHGVGERRERRLGPAVEVEQPGVVGPQDRRVRRAILPLELDDRAQPELRSARRELARRRRDERRLTRWSGDPLAVPAGGEPVLGRPDRDTAVALRHRDGARAPQQLDHAADVHRIRMHRKGVEVLRCASVIELLDTRPAAGADQMPPSTTSAAGSPAFSPR